jgi:hypothetical protein
MTIAFESPNLTAAIVAVQREAQGRPLRIASRPESYDSTDPAAVQAFLLQHANDAFASALGAPTPGLIARVPYRGLGIVLEPAGHEYGPSALVPADAKPSHIAVVWQIL